jgi:hypothetical protein
MIIRIETVSTLFRFGKEAQDPMTVRVGVDAAIDEAVLEDFTKEVNLVRVPEEPEGDIAVDFWVAAMPPRVLRRQWAAFERRKGHTGSVGGCGHLAEIVPARSDFVRCPGSARYSGGGMDAGCNPGHGKVLATLYRNAAPGQVGGRTAGATN